MNRTEAQARRLVWLFPLWMRSTRGEEAVGLVLDLLPPDAGRLPLRSRLDLVRTGLQARRRGTPPPRVWSGLSFARRRPSAAAIPVVWRPWLVSVVNRKRFVLQCAAMRNLFVLVLAVVFLASSSSTSWDDDPRPIWMIGFYLALWSASVLAFVVRRKRWRAAVLAANALDDDGRPLPPNQVELAWSAAGISNVPIAPGLAMAAVVSGGYGPVQWLDERHGVTMAGPVLALLLLAAAVGLALLVARRRLRAFDPASPASTASPRPGWRDDRVLAVLAGVVGGGLTGWLGAQLVVDGHLHVIAILAVPAGCLTMLHEVRAAQRRIGREIGLWDLLPGTAPQVIARETATRTGWASSGPGRPAPG